ncbi:uncharacterized protein LOC112568076 isoform X2 [Pomacea canaliculata]|uniref:uncharacterized protein LOC112568076 isoform X2 n=1 Tax=Pomacea canaliculata TaxID=400727 RepID=UPI000D734C85|nr:uncharacterized protein LOC112568076 isoform X2 [Pomacea canaliculata]
MTKAMSYCMYNVTCQYSPSSVEPVEEKPLECAATKMEDSLLVKYIYVLLMLHETALSQNCTFLEFYNFNGDTFEVSENSNVNLTFWLNTSVCKQSDVKYRIEVNTKTDKNTQEHEGQIAQRNGQCAAVLPRSVGCLSQAGPAVFYKKVNRSHVEIEWTWTWQNKDSRKFYTLKKILKLNVSYPPSVESLTVDGHEASGTYLLNDGQKVNVFCSFEKGNPTSRFHLLDQKRVKMATSYTEEYIDQSLTVHCEDDWPIISCEGKRSKQNRSVSFLVKCPPQFVNSTVKIDSSSDEQTITLNVKSYSSATGKCVLTPLSLLHNTQRQVTCNIRGEPPDLDLSFPFANENRSIKEWILTYQNEGGSANITIILNKNIEDGTEKDPLFTDKNGKMGPLIFTFSVLLIVIIIALVIVAALVVRKKRKENNGNTTSLEEKSSDLRGSFTEDISTDSHLHNHTYVSASSVRNQKKGRSKGESSSGPVEETYTSATEVRAKKRQEKLGLEFVWFIQRNYPGITLMKKSVKHRTNGERGLNGHLYVEIGIGKLHLQVNEQKKKKKRYFIFLAEHLFTAFM